MGGEAEPLNPLNIKPVPLNPIVINHETLPPHTVKPEPLNPLTIKPEPLCLLTFPGGFLASRRARVSHQRKRAKGSVRHTRTRTPAAGKCEQEV